MADEIVNPETLEISRSVKDIDQAASICDRLEKDNQDRVARAARVTEQFNDPPPKSDADLRAAGRGWEFNCSTGFFSSLIKRILVPFKSLIDNLDTLTKASCGQSEEDKDKKFQEGFTKLVRQWSGFDNLCSQIIFEDCMHGYCGGIGSDPMNWRPLLGKVENLLFPNGTSQNIADIPLFAYKREFMIHELAEKLQNVQASEDAGWNIENLIESINKAAPKKNAGMSNQREQADVTREASTLGTSYSQDVKVIEVWELFVVETATRKVSYYIIDRNSKKELMIELDRFESIEDCISVFTIENGSGKIHGSKGAGRTVYNTAVTAEKSRMNIRNNAFLAGLLLVKRVQGAQKPGPALAVISPLAILNEGFEVAGQQFQVNEDAFFSLDAHLTQVAEMQIGAFMPGQITDSKGGKRTATEINYTAQIEAQLKVGVLSRFLGQFFQMLYQMQKRAFSIVNIEDALAIYNAEQEAKNNGLPNSEPVDEKVAAFMKRMNPNAPLPPVLQTQNINDPEACFCILDLLRGGLDAVDIYKRGLCHPMPSLPDTDSSDQAKLQQFFDLAKGNPFWKQPEINRLEGEMLAGPSIVDETFIPQEDDTVKAVNTRWQLVEATSLMAGEPVPVSPQDDDLIHLGVLAQKWQEFAKDLNGATPETLALGGNLLDHAQGHIDSAKTKGTPDEQIDQYEKAIAEGRKAIAQTQSILSQLPQNRDPQLPAGTMPAAPMALSA